MDHVEQSFQLLVLTSLEYYADSHNHVAQQYLMATLAGTGAYHPADQSLL